MDCYRWCRLSYVVDVGAQKPSRDRGRNETGQLTLQKNAQSREYQGREVEGEDRRVGPGDTLWRILVKEKGLPENRFSQYMVIVRGLNPQITKIDVLRVGDNVFIPLRPDELLDGNVYRCKGRYKGLSRDSGGD